MKISTRLSVFVVLSSVVFLIFTGSASAAADFPADEAGICAYVKPNESINLSAVKPALSTIERETEDYIIGTVYLPWHSEVQYPHVYVSTDGWVVAYYPNDRSSGWLLPWYYYGGGAITTTTLNKVIETICTQINGTATGLKYYDFRHPDATKMMIIVEDAPSSDWFNVTIPTNYTTYRVDWSHQNIDRGYYPNSYAYLDSALFSSIGSNGRTYGAFNLTTEFQNGIEHTVSISVQRDADARVGLVLEYAE